MRPRQQPGFAWGSEEWLCGEGSLGRTGQVWGFAGRIEGRALGRQRLGMSLRPIREWLVCVCARVPIAYVCDCARVRVCTCVCKPV